MVKPAGSAQAELWPALPYEAWKDTCTTLHLWMQIVGKIRLAQTPWTNHSWHVTLHVTPRGLTTSPIPYAGRAFQIDFDFIDHVLLIQTSAGEVRRLSLEPRSVAEFHDTLMAALAELGIRVRIHGSPNEVTDPIPFREDRAHAAYDAEYVQRFWRVLLQADRLFKEFRTRFLGKVSPVHFFWGSFDHAVTRFSGRTAPPHPGGIPNLPDAVTREAYSHEVSSAGFWPGGGAVDYPAFYSYAYPTPAGLRRHAGAAAGRLLPRPARRVHPAVRRRPQRRGTGRDAAGFPADHVRGCGQCRELGPGRARVRVRGATSVRRVAAHGAGAMPEARDGSFQRINEALPESVSGLGPRPGGPRQRSGRRGRRTRAAHLERFPERRSPPAGPG